VCKQALCKLDAGIQVILSEKDLSLDGWKEVVPSAWLTSARTLPRHEVRIISDWEGASGACLYSPMGSISFLQAVVKVEIIDKETNQVVNKKEFKGSIPPESQQPCPETYTFTDSMFVNIKGMEPSLEEFQSWLLNALAKLGYQ
jgi:hypothetical protein